MDKKKVLFVYTEMIIGGATSALLSLLCSLNYEKYDVDLLLYENSGVRQKDIPERVRILPQANRSRAGLAGIARRLCSPAYLFAKTKSLYWKYIKKKPLSAIQVMAAYAAGTVSQLNEEYDTVISFLEFWPLNYAAFRVKAKHRISWIHIDYKQSTLTASLDREAFVRCDKIVLVSEQCLKNFQELCPEFADKAVYAANIVSKEFICQSARQGKPKLPSKAEAAIRLVSVCRIDFSHKGLDRAVEAITALKAEGLAGKLQWIVVGDGGDMDDFRAMIQDNGLSEYVYLVGSQLHPLPYVVQADAFFLPSRYEGKPISVTEAQMLGVPPLVTAYESAYEQIRDGVDGLIFENSTAGILDGLRKVLTKPALLEELRRNTKNTDYTDRQAVRFIDSLIGGELS